MTIKKFKLDENQRALILAALSPHKTYLETTEELNKDETILLSDLKNLFKILN